MEEQAWQVSTANDPHQREQRRSFVGPTFDGFNSYWWTLQKIAQFKNQHNEVKLTMTVIFVVVVVFFSQRKACCVCSCFKSSLFSAGRLQCQTLSDFFSSLWISHCFSFSFFRWSFSTIKARVSQYCKGLHLQEAGVPHVRRVPRKCGHILFLNGHFVYVAYTSQVLRRNRIPNSGAALRAVTNDECPVRVN